MKDHLPSSTALGVTVIRAVHQLIDQTPLILEDVISPRLLPVETLDAIRHYPDHFRSLEQDGLRSHVVLRSRYAEDELRSAVGEGLTQLISLGAGYDTFAFRQPDWAKDLRVVEVDHPATQRAKIDLFRRRNVTFAENTSFFPLDLEQGSLDFDRLSLDRDKPMFVSCLGVLAYLRHETVRRVFAAIGKLAKGSRIALAFAPKNHDGAVPEASGASQKAASHGEPWQTYFTEDELTTELTEAGFGRVSFLGVEEAASKYYRGRTDLPVPKRVRLCMGEV